MGGKLFGQRSLKSLLDTYERFHLDRDYLEALLRKTYAPASASFVIFKDEDGLICARNGSTGKIDYSGTDVGEVIQNALNSLTSGRTWREGVVLKGNFTINAKVAIPSHTVLEILGKLTLADNVNDYMFLIAGGSTDIEIIGGVVDCNGANQTSGGMLDCYGSKVKLFNVNVKNFKIVGASFYNSTGVSDIEIAHCRFEDGEGEGIRLIYVTNAKIHHNTFLNNTLDGINVRRDCTDINIHRNFGDGNRFLVYFQVGDGVTRPVRWNVSDNISLNSPANDGFAFWRSDYGTIKNNISVGHFAEGFSIVDCDHLVVEGNLAYNCQAGIGFGDATIPCDDVLCQNNKMISCTDFGMKVYATNSQFKGNTFKGSTTGIQEYSPSDGNEYTDTDLQNCTTPFNSTGTNYAVKHNRGYVTENSGTETFSGDGATTQFTFAHGLASAPTHVEIGKKHADIAGLGWTWTADATNITITFESAPPTGTSNVVFSWKAEV